MEPILSKRLTEVYGLLGQGVRPRQIAERLGIRYQTVRDYVKDLHLKLGVHSNSEIVMAYRDSAPRVARAGIIRLTPDEKLQRKQCYSVYRHALKSGFLKPKHCAVRGCIATESIAGHHEDYARPLDVVWLCRPHHEDLHLGRRLILVETETQ
jgi:DNA-binding CsgD family transcriptional regulator